jgi:hypothetical protein
MVEKALFVTDKDRDNEGLEEEVIVPKRKAYRGSKPPTIGTRRSSRARGKEQAK